MSAPQQPERKKRVAIEGEAHITGKNIIFDEEVEEAHDIHIYHNQATSIPRQHMPEEFIGEKKDSYKSNPSSFPDRPAVIDTVRAKAQGKKISLNDAEMLKENMIMKRHMEKENVVRFQALKKEREYYKDYFPNTEHQKSRLKDEVSELKEQSRYIREQSRYDRDQIDSEIQNRTMALNQEEQLIKEEMLRIQELENQRASFKNNMSSAHQSNAHAYAPQPHRAQQQGTLNPYMQQTQNYDFDNQYGQEYQEFNVNAQNRAQQQKNYNNDSDLNHFLADFNNESNISGNHHNFTDGDFGGAYSNQNYSRGGYGNAGFGNPPQAQSRVNVQAGFSSNHPQPHYHQPQLNPHMSGQSLNQRPAPPQMRGQTQTQQFNGNNPLMRQIKF